MPFVLRALEALSVVLIGVSLWMVEPWLLAAVAGVVGLVLVDRVEQ